MSTTGSTLHFDDDAFSFRADVRLENTSLTTGLPITQLDGRAQVYAERLARADRPRLALDLHANSLRAADRLVTGLDLKLASTPDGSRLYVDEFLGSIYGGAVLGEGSVALLADPLFTFELTLEHVALEPFIHPPKGASPASPSPSPEASDDTPQRITSSGLLSASLSIEASAKDASSRIGRGAVEVRQATLYNHPVPLAVLQAVNLTLPVDRSFDSASARYLIDGDTILLDSIRFDAPSLSITGSGTLDWPTQQLELNMVTRNPGMPNLGAIGEVINKFKDELMAIRITGPLSQPRGSVVTLTGLRRSWDELFTGKAARGPAAQPAPAP